jgi:hypothetical protein
VQKRTVSDYELAGILERQRTTTDGPRCTKRQLGALENFRRMLTTSGESIFTERQKEYLASIISIQEGNAPYYSEETQKIKKQVLALMHVRKTMPKVFREDVENFFSPSLVKQAVAEVANILAPYNIKSDEATDFVYKCGAQMMEQFAWRKLENVPKRGHFGTLFRSLKSELEYETKEGRGLDIAALPGLIRKGLEGTAAGANEEAREKLEYLQKTTVCGVDYGVGSFMEVRGGAPGLGKGGRSGRR